MNIKTRNRRKQNTKKRNKKYFHKSEKKKIRNISNKKGGASANASSNVTNNPCTIKLDVGDLVTDQNNKLLGIATVIDGNQITIKLSNGTESKVDNTGLKLYQYYDILGLLSQIVTNVIEMKNGGSPPKDINNISKLKKDLENAVSIRESNNSSNQLMRQAGFTINSDKNTGNYPGYNPPNESNVIPNQQPRSNTNNTND